MESENLDIESIMHARRDAVAESIREISVEELKSLEASLFPYLDHPWRAPFRQFLDENAGSAFYHATTNDRIQVLYCRTREKGIWFVPGSGVGILQAPALKVLREVVDAR